MWFMNNSIGLFLPAAGCRQDGNGSNTSPTIDSGTDGYYWSSDIGNNNTGKRLYFGKRYNTADVADHAKNAGLTVRCVKGTKQ